jgi:hypothetical protein
MHSSNIELHRNPISALLAAVADWLDAWSESARLGREAERLYELSTSELARLGLTRDRIFAHVYGGAN